MATEYLPNKEFERIIKDFQDTKQEQKRLSILIDDLKRRQIHKAIRAIEKDIGLDLLLREHCESFSNVEKRHHLHRKELADACYQLTENIARFAKFNLIDIEDAIQEGVMICFEKLDRFDPNKGKAFNYMTTCIFNHFRQLYRTARNYNELKKKYHAFLEQKYSENLPKTNRVEKKLSKKNYKDGW